MMSIELKVFRNLWGAESQFSSDINILFAELHRLGFNGIEASLNEIHRLSNNNDEIFMECMRTNQLELIGICYTNWTDFIPNSWENLTVEQHLENLKRELEQMVRYQPIHINIHSGQDTWTIDEHERFFQQALILQANYPNVSSSHETHRGRSLFNPAITLHMISRFPTLRVTADFSHFLVVCERLLNHPSDVERMKTIIERADHIHARVGTVQHAQVNNPLVDAPVEAELMQQWWQMIWTQRKKHGKKYVTLTPEYGPVPYATNIDVDVWKLINDEMNRQKNNFRQWLTKFDQEN